MFKITPNDGAKIPVTLKKDNATFTIPTDASVKCAIVSRDHTIKLTDDIVQASTEPGADWANSGIVAVFTPAQLAGITKKQPIEMEIQVTEQGGTPLTWWYECELSMGLINP